MIRIVGDLIFARRRSGLRRSRLPDRLHEPGSLFAQDALHAAYRVAFAVKQMSNAAQQVDIIGTIVAASARAFHRPDLRKAAFPKTQHMLRQIEIACHFTDGAERIGRFIQSGLPLASPNAGD